LTPPLLQQERKQMMRAIVYVMLAGLCMVFAMPVHAASVSEAGRALMEEKQETVVTLRLVIEESLSMPGSSGESTETTSEARGAVISPKGLIVMSLSETDPSSVLEGMGGMMGQDIRIDTELQDVTIIQPDGSEVDGRMVLRDPDFDLAFIEPAEAYEEDQKYIDLNTGAELELLDQVIILNRLGRIAGRNYAASVRRVESIVEHPRKFYVPSTGDGGSMALGSPVFNVDGEFVGILVLRSRGGGGGFAGASMRDNILPIILPAADILEAAQQAEGFEDNDD